MKKHGDCKLLCAHLNHKFKGRFNYALQGQDVLGVDYDLYRWVVGEMTKS